MGERLARQCRTPGCSGKAASVGYCERCAARPVPCRNSRCPEMVNRAERYCPEHTKQQYRKDREHRGSSSDRGYGGPWPKIQERYIEAHPECEDPLEQHGDDPPLANMVDHITALADGGTHAQDNLQSLCWHCHGEKTGQDTRRRRRSA